MNKLASVPSLLTRVTPKTGLTKNFARTFVPEDKTWGNRENAFESLDVKKHEEELLKKLRDQAKQQTTKATGTSPNSTGSAQTSKSTFNAPPPREEASSFRGPAYVSMTEFLEFRKDMVNRIRDLEDEVHDLRAKLYKS